MDRATWNRNPTIFEIDTWVWLDELSEKYGDFVELGSVPCSEWDALAAYGFDAVWLMGVWERSPLGIAISNRNPGLLQEFSRTLPDFHPLDNVGSAYCVRRYVVDQLLGGPEGLAMAREQLARRGMRLILDFVPNHVAADHAWAYQRPEYFIAGTPAELEYDPLAYRLVHNRVFACGRDPYFPAWADVLQLNAFHPGVRQAAKDTLAAIASQCDGVRCDMAMLQLNSIFEKTWGKRAGQRPPTEYWQDTITAIRTVHPGFLFMAESYWNTEWELQQQGFDYCYDKRLYDRLANESPESIGLHLRADLAYQEKLVRFIENHDEPRAASAFSPSRERAAAVAIATLPGARLFYDGQFEGRKIKLPVFLARQPKEALDRALRDFYRKLMNVTHAPVFHEGRWSLCESGGSNLLAWNWVKDEENCLIVINLSGETGNARIRVPWDDLEGSILRLTDPLSDASYEHEGDEVRRNGLYVELAPESFHLFQCRRIQQKLTARAA